MEERLEDEYVEVQDRSEKVPATNGALDNVITAVHAVHGLTLLRGLLESAAGGAVLHLLETLTAPVPDAVMLANAYSAAFQQLALAAQVDATPELSDAWQAHLAARLIDAGNLWSSQIERVGSANISSTLRAQARRDLRAVQRIFSLDAQTLWRLTSAAVTPSMPILRNAWVPWYDLTPDVEHVRTTMRAALARQIAASDDWANLVTPLEEYWARYGTGALARYHVLRWQGEERRLEGIRHPDTIQLESLIGHERQQSRLRLNIERFLAGLPAHDILLYGPPGTGKSSTVKAIANTYAEQGLCLLEISKEYISDLPHVIAQLRGRAPHYLVFVDDLSFEEHETAYKVLKVLLEGTAEARPANMLICATSNRINIIRENFQDRGQPTQDVNWRDTMDEKQSLAHRFGLRITFATPDQQQYLQIVNELVRQRGLAIAEETLHARALQWERQHPGRSGRVARQFVDELEAELKHAPLPEAATHPA
ncbi:MAG: ATP-binding protein [Ktedonobacteraceae bacterium]